MEQQSFNDSARDGFSSLFGQSGQVDNFLLERAQPYTESYQRASAAAQAVLPELSLSHVSRGSADPYARAVVVVDKSHHQRHVLQMQNGELKDVLTVPDATGMQPGLTEEGRFRITSKELNPTGAPPPGIPGGPVEPGAGNPLGAAAIGTTAGDGYIYLHGTNVPDSIGKNASHGCIRHFNSDILKIYAMVDVGETVYIGKNFKSMSVMSSDFR